LLFANAWLTAGPLSQPASACCTAIIVSATTIPNTPRAAISTNSERGFDTVAIVLLNNNQIFKVFMKNSV
jgi:hypothetical protein